MSVDVYVIDEDLVYLRPLRPGRSPKSIFAAAPVANLTASTSSSVTGESVEFDASGSTGQDLTYYLDTVATMSDPDATPLGQWELGYADSEGKLSFTFNSQGNKYVRLTVTDNFGQTDQAFFTVTVTGATAAPASAPTLTVQSTEDTITFTRDSVTDADTYEYEHQDDPGNEISIGTDTDIVFSGLSADTSRTIRVRARNAGGGGPWSDFVTGTTEEPTPADFDDAWDGGPGPLYVWFQANTGPAMEMPSTFNSFTEGNYTVNTNGAVVQDRHVTGTLRVMASNTTIRRCRANKIEFGNVNNYAENNLVEDCWVFGGTPYPIFGNGSNGQLNTIRRCYVDGQNRANNNGGIYGSGVRRIEYCHLRRHTDGAKMGSSTEWYYNLIEDPFDVDLWEGTGAAPHVDGLQASGGESNMQIWRNYIDVVVYDVNTNAFKNYSNAAIIINQNHPNTSSPSNNVLIKENFLNGGNNTLYLTDGGSTSVPPPNNGRVLYNMMGPDYRYGQFRHGSAVVSSDPAHLTADEQVVPGSGVNIVRLGNFNVPEAGRTAS